VGPALTDLSSQVVGVTVWTNPQAGRSPSVIDPATTTPLESNTSGDGWHLPTRRWSVRRLTPRLYDDGQGAGLLLPVSGVRAGSGRGILLRPDGVVVRTSDAPVHLTWQHVFDFRPHWSRGVRRFPTGRDVVHNWLTVDLGGSHDDSPRVDATSLALDPWLALRVLRHYLDHPPRRVELATEAALTRVATLGGSVRPAEQA